MNSPLSMTAASPSFLKWFLLILALACLGVFMWGKFYTTVNVRVGGEDFVARIADTQHKRAKGLGGSSPLARNEAMLFVFSEPGRHGFWMKGLTYPLDIIWISGGKIIDIAPRVPPPITDDESQLPRYLPRLAADTVLEVAAGTADRLGLKIDDKISVVAE